MTALPLGDGIAEVLADLEDDAGPQTGGQPEPLYLDHIVSQAMSEAGDLLRKTHTAFSLDIGQEKLQRRLRHEIGQRRRARGRLVADADVRMSIGTDDAAARQAARYLADAPDGLLVVPDRKNRRLVGTPTSVVGNPPNPYQWAPVLGQWAQRRQVSDSEDSANNEVVVALPQRPVVWEITPGLTPSAGFAGEVLGRQVYLMGLPVPFSIRQVLRWIHAHPDAVVQRIGEPELVLVPLPLLDDDWTSYQLRRLLREFSNETERLWHIDDNYNLSWHPEFAQDIDGYLAGTIGRLVTLHPWMRDLGTRVCTSVPIVQGLPRAVEKAIRAHLGWRAVARWTVVPEGGATHIGDGSPLVGERMIVWEARA